MKTNVVQYTSSGLSSRSGQIGIIVLLTMVVMLTLGISIVSRSGSDVSISRNAENANKALDAAESGAEKALSNVTNVPSGTYSLGGNNVSYHVSTVHVLQGDIQTGIDTGLDVTGVASGQGINVYWGKESACSQNPGSLVITVFNQNSPPVRRYYYGPVLNTNCGRKDNFTPATAGTSGFTNLATISLIPGDYLVKIRSVYNDTSVEVAGVNWNLPIEQYVVSSTAQNPIENQSKAVSVSRGLNLAPDTLDYSLYSGTTIVQQ